MKVIENRVLAAKRKKDRVKIKSIDDFKNALEKEGYIINDYYNEENFKIEVSKLLKIDKSVIDNLYLTLKEENIVYRSDDVEGFIEYIEKIKVFEDIYLDLCKKVSKIKTLIIERIEYDRVFGVQEDVSDIIEDIEKVASGISEVMKEEDKLWITELENEIHEGYVYAKDIELLKKVVINNKEPLKEEYDHLKKTKTIIIRIPEEINSDFIKAKKGSIEYYEHLNNSIPRMERLINNIHKYIKVDKDEKNLVRINQSEVLQDSINMAVAIFDNKEFKAISGSDEIENFCEAPPLEEAVFESRKVNKLGKLGIGYDRINDSEKKIFEEIHKQIINKNIVDQGNIVLYSKWEPCPSCYYVINQFIRKHPKITVQVRYLRSYGE